MEMEQFENPWMKKIRLLTKILLVSVAVNIGLITTLLYNRASMKQEEHPGKTVVLEESNGEVLASYFKKSFDDLTRELKEKSVLQDGYAKRDLALACLVNYHYLNLERAISGKMVQRRKLTFIHTEGGEGFQVEVFPNLDDLDFSLVEKFIKEEKWPFSAEGLFIDLKKGNSDSSLESAFFATPEFTVIYTALRRLDESLSREKVLKILMSGTWEFVYKWTAHLKRGGDLLEWMRANFREGFTEAAAFWISLDSEYIQRKLTDFEMHQLMEQVRENSPSVNVFLKQIMCSVRSDEVRKEAALKLYQFAGQIPPEPYSHEEALKTFLPAMFSKKAAPVVTASVKKHLVADGESLWKIARKYKVTIESLREANKLKTDSLKPGQELVIP